VCGGLEKYLRIDCWEPVETHLLTTPLHSFADFLEECQLTTCTLGAELETSKTEPEQARMPTQCQTGPDARGSDELTLAERFGASALALPFKVWLRVKTMGCIRPWYINDGTIPPSPIPHSNLPPCQRTAVSQGSLVHEEHVTTALTALGNSSLRLSPVVSLVQSWSRSTIQILEYSPSTPP